MKIPIKKKNNQSDIKFKNKLKLPTKKPKRRIKKSNEKSLSSIIKERKSHKRRNSSEDVDTNNILESKVLNSKTNL